MLQQVFERAVRQTRLVRPGRIAKDAVEPVGIGRFNGTHGPLDRLADIARMAAHLIPMRAVRDDKTVIGRGAGIGRVAGFGKDGSIFLIPDIRDTLVEEQGEDILLVIPGFHQATQNNRRAPQIGFQGLQ